MAYVVRRILACVPVAIGVVVLVSLVMHAVPGDPVDAILGDYATLDEKLALRAELGLNQPIPAQLLTYLGKVLSGDLGHSLLHGRPVLEMIAERIQPTAELACVAMLVALAISIPLGLLSALYAGSLLDVSAMLVALLGVAIPNFWLGPMLVLVFSLQLDWLPVSERGGWETYVLPAITLGTALAAILSRMTRNTVLETLRDDYVRTARAKGAPQVSVLGKHVLRNACLPVVTIIGLQFGVLLTGSIITETIFDWPGLGTLLVEALNTRDYPLVQGCVLVFSGFYLLVNLATDLLYGVIDPRIRCGGGR